MEDTYLLGLINGEDWAYRQLIRTYQDMAYTLALSIVKDNFTAQEVAQDAFLKVFKGVGSFNRNAGFKTWLYKIIVNEAFQRLRNSTKEILFFQETYEDTIAETNSGYNSYNDEQTSKVNWALRKLSPKESLALRLFYMEDESLKNISSITGWSIANTKIILHRGRKNMVIIMNELNKKK